VTRTTTTWLIEEQYPNLNSIKMLALKPKLDPERSLWHWLSFSKELMHSKRQLQLKPEKTASSKKRKTESILSTEIYLTTSSDESENK
jgi:hypothetical protein